MVGGAAQEIDPYHVTFGAGGTSVQFSDGEAAGGHMRLSLDVPLIENCALACLFPLPLSDTDSES